MGETARDVTESKTYESRDDSSHGVRSFFEGPSIIASYNQSALT